MISPPYYGLRNYNSSKQIGLEDTPEEYLKRLFKVFSEIKRVLKKDGTLWLNMGDSYAVSNYGRGNSKSLGKIQLSNKESIFVQSHEIESKLKEVLGYKPKDMLGIPWRMALMLQKAGWYLRQDIIWAKPNPMPESVKDRCTKSHEYIFLLAKSRKYYFNSDAIKEKAKLESVNRYKYKFNTGIKEVNGNGRPNKVYNSQGLKTFTGLRNKRDVWIISPLSFKGSHFATFQTELVEPCILAGCPENGIVLDPFIGSGTVGVVAKGLNRNYIGIDVNPDYCELAKRRIG